MGKGTSQPPAPDPQIGKAALMNAELGKEWLSFAKDTYAVSQERQKPIDDLAKKVTQNQLDTSIEQQAWARQAHDRYVNEFQPLQDKFVEDAENWDSPERQAAAAAAAKADVIANATQQRAATNRQLTAMGVNPASGRFAGINRAADIATGVTAAGAATGARRNVEKEGVSLRGTAINIGNGLPAQASQAVGLGLNAGTGAANVTNAANGQFLAAVPMMAQGYQGAMAGYSNQANILNDQYKTQVSVWQTQEQIKAQQTASLMQGIGGIFGMFAGMSSKKFKKDKKKSKGNLDAVKKMPVERWRYKEGIADGGAAEHTGPYAEDFKKATGHGDGKVIPFIDAIGITMGAVQELSSQVDRLEHAVGIGAKNTAHAPKRKSMKKAA
ncbi:MAG TPA: tail fiber domain-containing protein [Nitrobacter sp.]|mgnify:CR=1 FL=1|nr:tail fiber domain-containing protein [Nitrobacter sp.]